MKVLVLGGTGFVGGHLCNALKLAGHSIRLVVHRQKDLDLAYEQVEGDVTELSTIVNAGNGCDAVINLVGIIREFPSRGITFQRLHVLATRNALEVAKRSGIKRFLQMSALGTRPGASSHYHRSKFQGEEEVRASALDYTIFRPSIIFGPADDFINKLAGYIKQYPVVPVIGDGAYRLQPIAGDDVARCFTMALERIDTIGKSYEICGPTRMSYLEMLDIIGRNVGKAEVRKAHAPLGMMRMIVPLLQKFPWFPITADQIAMLVEENICDGSWQAAFPFAPRQFEEGIKCYLTA
jgi:NADH dehydrogenase